MDLMFFIIRHTYTPGHRQWGHRVKEFLGAVAAAQHRRVKEFLGEVAAGHCQAHCAIALVEQKTLDLEGSQGQGVLGHTFFTGPYNHQDDAHYWVLEYNRRPYSHLKDGIKVLCKTGKDSTNIALVVHTHLACWPP